MEQRNIEGIQQLRGICVFLTALAHLPLATLPFALLGIIAPYTVGVSIFYGISGWIIAYVTDNATIRSLGNFYIKRLFRIIPILYCTLAFALFMACVLHHNRPFVNQFYPDVSTTWLVVYRNLIFGADTFNYAVIASLMGLWSISVEVKFYFVYGCLLALSTRARLPALIVLVIMIAILRCHYVALGNPSFYSHVFYIELFGLGAISYHFRHINTNNLLVNCVAWAWIIAFPCFALKGNLFLAGYFGFCIAVTYVVSYMTRAQLKIKHVSQAMHWLGERSYVYYVFHFQFLALGGLLGQALKLNYTHPNIYNLILILSLIIGLPITEFLHRTVENHGVKLGKKTSDLFSKQFLPYLTFSYANKRTSETAKQE
jgi:peptidoglycan/LPS O-acetylase OafA/YrhL